MAEIVLDGVSKRFSDGTQAVHPTDLTIADGEFFILVGPSGCGKSTLLNLIVGLIEPSSGELRVDGERVNERDPKDRNMAMVFQSYAIYPHMSVRDNIAFPLRLAGAAVTDIDARVEQVAELLELADLLGRKPAELSGGQRQRVAMGRAIVREPIAFLLDEPLSNLDARLRVQMRNELARLQRRLGTTTVYVTHDQTEAMTLGQRVAVMHEGRVQQVGTPRELYERPANLFVAGFVGAPAMNFMPAEIRRDKLALPMLELELPEAYAEAAPERCAVIAGIRPEHFIDSPSSAANGRYCAAFTAAPDRIEWLGADQLVYIEWPLDTTPRSGRAYAGLERDAIRDGRVRIVARVGAATEAAEGEPLRLCIDVAAVSLFDAESGARIEPRRD